MGDIWKRLRGGLTNDQGTGSEGSADRHPRQSRPDVPRPVITNITNLLAIVPSLNLTGDPDVARFCAEIQRELDNHRTGGIAEDPKAREDVIARADEILSKMSSYL